METFAASQNYRKRLIDELVQRQRKNPSYSLRCFARDLKISPTALSQVLNAKRNLSRTNVLKVAERLAFTPSETQLALGQAGEATIGIGDEQYTLLNDDVFRYMSDWYYFAILCLAETGRAKSDPEWVAKRFGISTLEAREAISRLQRLGLIEIKKGMLFHDGSPLRTTTDIPSSAARLLQSHHLRLAEKSLQNDPIHLRDMTSMTMAIKLDRIPKAKEMIKTFRRKLCKLLESKDGEEVYVLSLQLFPATHSEGTKK